MTETEWTTGADPRPMLASLRPRASDRKLRLFAASCCRRIWDLLPDERCRSALEVAERFADNLASPEDLHSAREAAVRCFVDFTDHDEAGHFTGRESASAAVAGACWTDEGGRDAGLHDVVNNCYGLGPLSNGWKNGGRIEYLRQCRDIRDIFGNPFRTVDLAPAWVTPDVMAIARSVYDMRAFERLGELAKGVRPRIDVIELVW